jgi:hypothetical protein
MSTTSPANTLPNVVYHIKHYNMINHYNKLKSINITNDDLKLKIDTETIVIKIEEKQNINNIQIPSEITNNINKKPWIRIPYPIREIKLMEYLTEKNMNKEDKDKYMKLLYEKKLTNKIVSYNNLSGKIEDITIDNI